MLKLRNANTVVRQVTTQFLNILAENKSLKINCAIVYRVIFVKHKLLINRWGPQTTF